MNLYLSMTSEPHVPTTDNWAHLVFDRKVAFWGVGLSGNSRERSRIKALI